MTFLLPCGATKALHVAPGLAVDCLLRLVASAVADSDVAGMPKRWGGCRGVAAGLLLLRCDGRLLRDGGATLAEAGVTGGSRIEVLRASNGGMPGTSAAGSYRSVTRSNLEALIRDSAALLLRGGFTGPVTSHAVQGLFQNAKRKDADGRVLEAYPSDVVAEPFHPQTRWPGRFSGRLPSITVTYAWAMDLVRELPAFLDEAERMLRLTDEEKQRATWWLDIFFNDQNLRPEQMPNVLGKAKLCYLRAENHMVMLKGGIFGRCWCLMELIYRIQVPPSPPRCCAPLHVPFPDCAPSCRKRC